MRLDQLAIGVDADESRVAAHPDPLAEKPRRYEVECLAEADVMIGVHAALRPPRRIEAFRHEGEQRRALDILKDAERPLARGAVDARARRLADPRDHARLHVREIAPRLAAKEILAEIRHPTLDVGLARRCADRRGIEDEAPMPRVLLHRALKDRVVPIRFRDRGAQVVEDDAARDAAEKHPRIFEPVNHRRDGLCERDVDVLMSARRQDDEERPGEAATIRQRIVHEPETAEVDLGEVARRDVGHAHGDAPARAEAAVLHDEAMERAIGDGDTGARQQRHDL
jgi:hypothetical protein